MKPQLTVVIGANGAGKTTWTRSNRDQLPEPFYNADSIAEGLGDANSPASQERARELVDQEIEDRMRLKEDFGFESTWSGKSRPDIVRDASTQGYTTRAVFLGTNHPGINISRVRQRVREGGHNVPESEIVRRWTAAYENLLANWGVFDEIDVLDSSTSNVRAVAGKRHGKTWTEPDLPTWASSIGAITANTLGPPRDSDAARPARAPDRPRETTPHSGQRDVPGRD